MRTEIEIPVPDWNSELARIILALEHLRKQDLYSEVPDYIFLQLKEIFQILETLGSGRIEGNNTTLSEYVEKIIEKNTSRDEKREELENIESGIRFIERQAGILTKIDRAYVSELHKIVTRNLTPPPAGEGSHYPGDLRKKNVMIKGARHTPPSLELLNEFFDNFLTFINSEWPEQNQLLMVAIAHHRFMYIHPFDNGNGRMGRLLNYALLIKLGFNVNTGGRIFNPSSVFYTDRDKYYEMLSRADTLSKGDLLAWSEYFLKGLKNEIEKVNRLMDRKYTQDVILLPSLKHALDRKYITETEFGILSHLVKNREIAIKASELKAFGVKTSQQKSYVMGKLRGKGMVKPIKDKGRVYTISFANSYLLRSVIQTLTENGFIADFLSQPVPGK